MAKNTTLYVRNKVAGVVNGDTLKRIITDVHSQYCRKFAGYGLNPETLDEAEALGASKIQIVVEETRKQFNCTIAEWRRYAIGADLGFGYQLFMPLKYFKYCESNKHQLSKNEPVPVQFTMFG